MQAGCIKRASGEDWRLGPKHQLQMQTRSQSRCLAGCRVSQKRLHAWTVQDRRQRGKCHSVDAECARLQQVMSRGFNRHVVGTCTDRYLLQVAARIWQLALSWPKRSVLWLFLLTRCQKWVQSTYLAYLVVYGKQVRDCGVA